MSTPKIEFTTTPGSHAESNGHWDKAVIELGRTVGGVVVEPLLNIQFQNGPVREHGVNGVQLTAVLKICLARYRMLNRGEFFCHENSLVITKLEEAIMWDQERTAKRTAAGVEGFDKPVTLVVGDLNTAGAPVKFAAVKKLERRLASLVEVIAGAKTARAGLGENVIQVSAESRAAQALLKEWEKEDAEDA